MIWSATTGVADRGHVVLVHGSLDRSAGLLKLSRRLHDRYLVTRYDRRGYGRSRPHEGPFGIEQQVDDLIETIESAGPVGGPRIVFGHSYGGNVGLALAAVRPDLVDGVVTYETPLPWRSWWPGTPAHDGTEAWHADPEAAAERFMRRLVGDARWQRLPPSTRAGRRAEGAALVGELLDLGRRAAWDPDDIVAPVLAVHGEHGRDHHRRAAETIAGEIVDGRCAVLHGASHAGPNTHPDDVAELLDRFVRERVRLG